MFLICIFCKEVSNNSRRYSMPIKAAKAVWCSIIYFLNSGLNQIVNQYRHELQAKINSQQWCNETSQMLKNTFTATHHCNYPLWATLLLQGYAMAFNLSQHISNNLHERADHSNKLMNKFIPCLKLKIHQVLKKITIESILDYYSTLAATTQIQLFVKMLNF